MKTIAPAKINWTLEVLGRREDGYHEIRSVMQTIDLCDEVRAWRAPELRQRGNVLGAPAKEEPRLMMSTTPLRVKWSGGYDLLDQEKGANPWTLQMFRSARLLDPSGELDAEISVAKNIPVAAGLGGGSSDAGAAMRLLDRLWAVEVPRETLSELASTVGSDVAFFLFGGTALAEGRGERITPLPDTPTTSLVLVTPPIRLTDKTKRVYESLSMEDFTDGSRGEALAQRLRTGKGARQEDLHNVFERVAFRVFEGLETYREALIAAGVNQVHLAGAGPTLFTLAANDDDAREIARRVDAPGAKVIVARTLGAGEATAVTD